jgi:hypothetical protein
MFASNLSDSMGEFFEQEVGPCQMISAEQPEFPAIPKMEPDFNFLDIRSLLNPKPIQYP